MTSRTHDWWRVFHTTRSLAHEKRDYRDSWDEEHSDDSTPSAASRFLCVSQHDENCEQETAVIETLQEQWPALPWQLVHSIISGKCIQCSSRRSGVTWSNLRDMEIKRAAALRTDCSLTCDWYASPARMSHFHNPSGLPQARRRVTAWPILKQNDI